MNENKWPQPNVIVLFQSDKIKNVWPPNHQSLMFVERAVTLNAYNITINNRYMG